MNDDIYSIHLYHISKADYKQLSIKERIANFILSALVVAFAATMVFAFLASIGVMVYLAYSVTGI